MSALFEWEPPSWIGKEAWDAFVEMRKAKGKRAPWTNGARDGIIRQLDRLRSAGNNPDEVLWQSVRNGWSDVYALKVDKSFAIQETVQREAALAKEKEEIRATKPPPEVMARLRELTAKMRMKN
jgi:hypothetical protein